MMINENHTVMQSPYLRTLYALTKIKGPLVDAWHKDQVNKIREEVTRANNPVGRDKDVIWTDFETAFTAAFTDTAKKQNAANALKQLRMKGNDLDTYTATFKLLVKEAGYDITNPHCFKRFGKGLPKELLSAILRRDQTPISFNTWVNAAKTELAKMAEYEAMMGRSSQRYEWRTPRQIEQQHLGHHRHHGHGHHRRNGNGRPHHDTDL